MGESKTVEIERGRLKYVRTMRQTSNGWTTTGSWFTSKLGKRLDGDSFDGCDASPNESVEAFVCFRFEDIRMKITVVRMLGDEIEVATVLDSDSRIGGSKNAGEWASQEDGRWLVFKDFFYNVVSDQRIEVKGLPDYPAQSYRAASPDLSKVVYFGDCFISDFEMSPELRKLREGMCSESGADSAQGRASFWVTDTSTGSSEIIKIELAQNDWVLWDRQRFPARRDWLKHVQSRIVWERTATGGFAPRFY